MVSNSFNKVTKDLSGKKLLILGGIASACEIVNEAHKMGIIVYVLDYLKDSPAKKIADKSFLISILDIDSVVKLIQNEKIDGIITGFIDSILPACVEIAKKARLPFWANSENVSICIQKDKFRKACLECSVPVIPQYNVKDTNDILSIKFPVVIKPADNSGSRGVYICYTKDEFNKLYEKSLSYSKSGDVIIEKYIKGNEFSVYYTLIDGEAYISAMGDCYINQFDPNIAPISQGKYHPSIHLKLWEKEVHPKMKCFFEKNNMKNGLVFIQGFYDHNQFYVNEIGYRLNGGFTYKLIEHCAGYNQMELLIRFVLTGSMMDKQMEKALPHFQKHALKLTISLKQGVIDAIEGEKKILSRKEVVSFIKVHSIGDELNSVGTTAQILGYFHIVTESKAEMMESIQYIRENLKVYDTNGTDMLLPILESSSIKIVELNEKTGTAC